MEGDFAGGACALAIKPTPAKREMPRTDLNWEFNVLTQSRISNLRALCGATTSPASKKGTLSSVGFYRKLKGPAHGNRALF